MKRIKQIKCEVQSKCQNDCTMCAHGEQRRLLPYYELSLAQLEKFLDVSRRSGYFIETMRIHGPGEPLLWRHFNEGVALMKRSGIIGSIFVATNGLLLHKISEAAWECIDEMRVSLYSSFKGHRKLHDLIDKRSHKINIHPVDTFRRLPVAGEEAAIPCRCLCDGPMLMGDRVFLYCGPPVFGAVERFDQEIFVDSDLSVPVDRNWLSAYQEKKKGHMYLCKRCWANSNFAPALATAPHQVRGGKWHAAM